MAIINGNVSGNLSKLYQSESAKNILMLAFNSNLSLTYFKSKKLFTLRGQLHNADLLQNIEFQNYNSPQGVNKMILE